MIRNLLEKVPRASVGVLGFWLPAERRRRLERYLRGWEQNQKLERADAVIVSFGKSGRTWVRVLLSGFYQRCYGLSPRTLLGFDNLHRKNARIPRIFLTHDNYIQDYSGAHDSKRDFYDKRVILLVRCPQDTVVSQYFQWKFRMRPNKKALNDYPAHGAEVSLFDFAMGQAGLTKIIDFMNLWARERERVRDLLIVRYEDLRADTPGVFARIVRFLGGPEDPEAIRAAVEYASIENMRKLETKRVFWMAGGRMTARDKDNPDSYKVRRAKVGGYRDYFDDEEVARIDATVRAKLSPVYGYDGAGEGGEQRLVKPVVFIHTNAKQQLGALVAQYALQRNSRHPERFEVRLLEQEQQRFFRDYEGRRYLRDGAWRVWKNDDLQSFTPLRFMPPELMGYQGRALVIDPDIFAQGDVVQLLERDMQGKAILCRRRSGWKKKTSWASSVMLLECALLEHWHCEQEFASLFAGERDYADWIGLRLEPQETIGHFEDEWNDFDRLSPRTQLLHNTRRWTQPWKTGLPVDFVPGDRVLGMPLIDRLMRWRRERFGDYALLGRYIRHPDRNQERFFFGLLRECLDRGIVSESMLRAEMQRNHVRHDAFEVLDRTPALPV